MAMSLSIRSKTVLLACGSAAVALGLACVGFAINGVRTLKDAKLRQLSDQVKMVAFHASPVLTLRSREAGERLLASLESDRTVEIACIVDPNGSVVASRGDGFPESFPAGIPSDGESRFIDFGHVEVIQPVVVGKTRLGHIWVRANTKDLQSQLLDFAQIAGYVLATAMTMSLLLSMRLQRGISTPIVALTNAAQRITIADDYSIRVELSTDPELRTLQSTFNRMLDHIQTSDQALQEAHNELEERVADRTRELSLEITCRKKTQADLERAIVAAEAASRAKSEFLANVSHEIRTPLNSIIGFTDFILSDGECGPDEQREYLQTIRRSGMHLADLINDVLDLSKIEAGRWDVDRLSFSPHDAIADVVSALRMRAQEKGLRLTYEWTSALPERIESDPGRFRQLLVNLVGNAIKFTEQGSIRVTAGLSTTTPPQFQVDVIDTGIGIPESKLESIFEPFTQADTSVTRRFGGTGLGLAISRKIATSLGGTLTVVSRLKEGSQFTLTLDPGPLEGVRMLTTPPEAPNLIQTPKEQENPSFAELRRTRGRPSRVLVEARVSITASRSRRHLGPEPRNRGDVHLWRPPNLE